jgi:ribosome-associated protein
MEKQTKNISIPLNEIEFRALPSQGAGGQNVNKVATAIHLRFNINDSSLPEIVKSRLRQRSDHRITGEGIIIINAQSHRTQERNRAEAISRLHALVASAWRTPVKRKPTKPSRAARGRRVDSKTKRGQQKSLRKKVDDS